jgi:hypothetical protein
MALWYDTYVDGREALEDLGCRRVRLQPDA